jgi:hypothetical protein
MNSGIQPKLGPQMRESLRIHGATIQDELPQRGQTGFREEGAWSPVGRSHLDEAALQHGLHRGRDLRLVPPLATTPGAQENTIRDGRVLAEVTAQLAPKQIALGCGVAPWMLEATSVETHATLPSRERCMAGG